jgi:alkylhydroperoxidase/carboxymuconolactone decarboxylase family protein YurZ
MNRFPFGLWRVFFALSALLILVGGPQHPGGTMAEMLANPKWVPSHVLMLAGFLAFLAGLILYQRSFALPDRTRRWVRLAVIATALQAVEMAFHTAAAVDHANLVAGRATPVLTTHLWLAVALYPVFGLAVIGLIVAATRDRVLGSPWIAWIGILGALAHGAAAPLTILTEISWARLLFPFLMLLALWLLLAALWPIRMTSRRTPADAPIDPAAASPAST